MRVVVEAAVSWLCKSAFLLSILFHVCDDHIFIEELSTHNTANSIVKTPKQNNRYHEVLRFRHLLSGNGSPCSTTFSDCHGKIPSSCSAASMTLHVCVMICVFIDKF